MSSCPRKSPAEKIYQLLLSIIWARSETIRDIDKLVHVFQVKILLCRGSGAHRRVREVPEKVDGKAYFSLRSGGWCAFNARPRKAF